MTTPPSASGSQGLGPRANWKRKLRFLQSAFRGSPIHSIRRRLTSRSSERKSTAVTTTVDRPPRLTLQNLAVSKNPDELRRQAGIELATSKGAQASYSHSFSSFWKSPPVLKVTLSAC